MSPIVIDEETVFSFNFWLNDSIHYGMYYNNELFGRLACFDIQLRSQVYQLGCQLTQQKAFVVITCSATSCCLWGGLRTPLIKKLLLKDSTLQLPQQPNYTC